MVKKRGLTIKISPRATYSILAIIIILMIGGIVWAYGTNDPATFGHSAGEINGVCRYDSQYGRWFDCPNFQDELNLYIENGKLCWPTSSINSCNLVNENCAVTNYPACSIELEGICSLPRSVQTEKCIQKCKQTIACTGDLTPYSCGIPGAVKYTTGTVDYCNSALSILYCRCSVPSTSYKKEVPSSTGKVCVP